MKYCTHCGAELIDEAVLCTKCGCWTDNPMMTTALKKARINVCALVGFILSMVSIFFFINILGLLALAGMIVSIVGLAQTVKNSEQRGKGLAIAGTVVGACSFLFGFMIWTLLI